MMSYFFMRLRFYKKLTLLLPVLVVASVYWQNQYTVPFITSDGVKNFISKQVLYKLATFNYGHSALPHCPSIPPELKGVIILNSRVPDWAVLEQENAMLDPGGRYKPSSCLSRNRVAIIVSYRDRETHLKIFLQHLHPFLQRQQLDYGIYVIEMAAGIPFNRALLMNVGYKEALQQYDHECFIFHDVDLLPEDDRNLYACAHMPRHMSVSIDTLKYRLPYTEIFGGVSALHKDHFDLINGFSNIYFGWGGEDDDLFRRIIHSNLTVSRDIPQLSRYKMLAHKMEKPNPKRYSYLKDAVTRQSSDGLTSLKYTVIKKELKRLFTWILVSINVTDFQTFDTSTTTKKLKRILYGKNDNKNKTDFMKNINELRLSNLTLKDNNQTNHKNTSLE